MAIKLFDYQLDAINRMRTGCVLCGGVGSGKSFTSLGYYYLKNGGFLDSLMGGSYNRMRSPSDLYIITTARKRDTCEWEKDMSHFLLSPDPTVNGYKNKIIVDSWNNIEKYIGVTEAFFIFDEQRVVGNGKWSKSFVKICKNNDWILLSATPGDKWEDYIPVFIANGFYRNRTEFSNEHLIYSRFGTFPKVEGYRNLERLTRLRDRILVDMDFHRSTISHHEDIEVLYDRMLYKKILKDRWDIWNNKPIENPSRLCQALRKVVNEDPSRQEALLEILEKHPRVIVFYNYNYELEILRNLVYPKDTLVAEWNGYMHQPIPDSKKWVYLVQYTAGAEGWNCITTDTIVFFSQNYSYKVMIQSSGRIDRLNTPYKELWYYHFKASASIELAIARAIRDKKKFNESAWSRKILT